MSQSSSQGPVATDGVVESRRSFLAKSTIAAGAVAGAASAALLPKYAQAAGSAGLTLPNNYPGQNAKLFAEIRSDERTHVHFLLDALGSSAIAMPTFQNLTVASNNPVLFASYAAVFENTGVGAYLGALPYIYDPSYREAAASIALVEGYHSGWLNSLVNFPLTPQATPFIQPFTVAQVLQNATPFLANPSQLPTLFSTTPSPANDILILNFALVLEYLEMTFYNINVPIFFNE